MKLLRLSLAALLFTAMAAIAGGLRAQDRSAPVAVGELAPDFTLEDQNKTKVTLSAARNKSPVVLVFYRGYW
jgi:cytochrome oxidase Cu insertion factor (SCO1/SenC/PrrC family)